MCHSHQEFDFSRQAYSAGHSIRVLWEPFKLKDKSQQKNRGPAACEFGMCYGQHGVLGWATANVHQHPLSLGADELVAPGP
jgi:hypothetical protein